LALIYLFIAFVYFLFRFIYYLFTFFYCLLLNLSPNKQSCLYWAVRDDKLNIVKYFLEEGKVDVDCNEFGFSPILGASGKGNNKMIEYLLSSGANINANHKYNGLNALHNAAFKGNFETVKLLVSLGCDFNAREYTDDSTPLQWAQDNSKQKEVVDFLKQVNQK
jgi:ankyrin repeat protein